MSSWTPYCSADTPCSSISNAAVTLHQAESPIKPCGAMQANGHSYDDDDRSEGDYSEGSSVWTGSGTEFR